MKNIVQEHQYANPEVQYTQLQSYYETSTGLPHKTIMKRSLSPLIFGKFSIPSTIHGFTESWTR